MDSGLVGASQKSKLYEQLADKLCEAIATGTLRAGDRLPSVRQLSNQERVSISTVLQALTEQLTQEASKAS